MGEIIRLQLISNNCCYGPEPEPEQEVEQRLTIEADGKVRLSRYSFGKPEVPFFVWQDEIDPAIAQSLLSGLGNYFFSGHDIVGVTDVGSWTLQLENSDGKVTFFSGALISGEDDRLDDLSRLLRRTLHLYYLWAFNTDVYGGEINRLVFKFTHATDVTPPPIRIEDLPIPEVIHLIFTEEITIDRAAEDIIFRKVIGAECNAEYRYHVGEGVPSFLDEWSESDLFVHTPQGWTEGMEEDKVEMTFDLAVDFADRDSVFLSGPYYKEFLPQGWADFMFSLRQFTSFYDGLESMNYRICGKSLSQAGKLMYCSVEFELGGKTYYYISEDADIAVGDQVVVPVGNHDRTAVVRVTKIEFFDEVDAPMEPEGVKHIIRKCNPEEYSSAFEPQSVSWYCPALGREVQGWECDEISLSAIEHERPDIDSAEEWNEEKREICRECPRAW